jgi:hypothetical protein
MRIPIKVILMSIFSIYFVPLSAQEFTGNINDQYGNPVSYVRVHIPQKNIGTYSDKAGVYRIVTDFADLEDTITFSCPGYDIVRMSISDFIKTDQRKLILEKKPLQDQGDFDAGKEYTIKTIGIDTKSKFAEGLLTDMEPGYEFGIMMNSENEVFVEKLIINVIKTTYDTILFRLNIYKPEGENKFIPILDQQIFIELPKEKSIPSAEINLSQYHIKVDGTFLVTLEQIKVSGSGEIVFNCSPFKRTYIKDAFQPVWRSMAVGLGICLVVKTGN